MEGRAPWSDDRVRVVVDVLQAADQALSGHGAFLVQLDGALAVIDIGVGAAASLGGARLPGPRSLVAACLAAGVPVVARGDEADLASLGIAQAVAAPAGVGSVIVVIAPGDATDLGYLGAAGARLATPTEPPGPSAPRRFDPVLEPELERWLERSPDMQCITRLDGSLLAVNQRFVAVLGWSRDELLAMPRGQLIHPDDVSRSDAIIEQLATGTASIELTNRYKTRGGDWRWLAWSVAPSIDEGLVFATARDVTAQRQADRFGADQRACLEMIARGAPLVRVLERLTTMVEVQAPGMLASVVLLDATGTRIRSGAAPSLPPGFVAFIDGAPIGPAAGSCGTAAYLKCLVISEDISVDPRWVGYKDQALAADLRACWSLPVMSSRDEVLGTFAMYYREPRSPSAAELVLLDAASRLASVAIERDRATGTVELLRRALDRTSDIVLITEAELHADVAPRVTYVNKALERVTGWPPEAVRGHPVGSAAIGDPEHGGDLGDRAPLAGLRSLLADASATRSIVSTATAYGRWRSIEVDIAPLTDEAGALTHRVAIGRDVTERLAVDAELRQRERRFRALASATSDAMWDWDLATDAMWWSDGYYQLFGYEPDHERSTVESWTAHIHPDDRDAVLRSVRAVIEGGGRSWTAEYRFVRKDGSIAWVVDRGVVVRDDAGHGARVVCGMTDLTERRAAELRLREQAELLDQISDAIVVENLDGVIRLWNRAAERMYGIAAADAIGHRAVDLIYRDVAAHEAAFRGVRERGAWASELTHRTAAGRDLVIDARWSLVRDDAGNPRGVLGVQTDVTEKKQLEAQYLRAQRLESIGNLAGGIAHDLNNVLTPILMGIPLLRDVVAGAAAIETLDAIEQAAERGADMVKQVLSFARGVGGQRTPVDVHQVLHDVARFARDSFLRAIEVRVTAPAQLPPVLGDATQLHQVLLNLVVNARDAMPDGGVLTLAAENIAIDDSYAASRSEARPGHYVVVRVSDTGTGITASVRDRMFEPFFTTKAPGQGTGLGLSTVLGLVKAHGGFIDLHTEAGRGSRFEVFLPAAVDASHSRRPPRPEPLRGAGELVLLIDDEAAVLKVTRRILESYGYRVVAASDGAEALALYTQNPGISVVVTDVMMPVMDGVATARALLRLDPRLAIIAVSGVSTPMTESRLAGVGVKHLLPKPFTAEALLRLLREVLGARSA